MFEFTGAYSHALDSKGRLTLPSPFREHLNQETQVVMAIGLNQCLTMYPIPVWLGLLEQLKALPKTDPQALAFKRVSLASAFKCDTDRHGRLLVPPRLRELASITREVMVVGNLEVIEIWDRRRWDDYFQQGLEQFESNASKLQL